MGSYHGRHGFDQLSHLRSCLIKQLSMEGVNSMRYPPHTAKKLGWARFFLAKQTNLGRLRRLTLLATLVGLAAFVVQVKELRFFVFLLTRVQDFWWKFLDVDSVPKSNLKASWFRQQQVPVIPVGPVSI